jgi:hypothetical protein
MLAVSRLFAFNSRMIEDLEGFGRGLIQELSRYLPEGNTTNSSNQNCQLFSLDSNLETQDISLGHIN